MKELFKPISFLKKGIASAVIVCLIWTQFCVGVAKAVLPSDADLGMSDVIIYQTDSMGFTVSATDTGTGIQTQYFAGGMIDYTYYTVYNENGERIEIEVTDYDYHPDGRIKTITDCQTGDYIIYGNIGKDLDGDGEITGDEIKGWGAVEERAKADAEHPEGRIIGIYEYDAEGVLTRKNIWGDKDNPYVDDNNPGVITSYIVYVNGEPQAEMANYLLLDTDGDPSTAMEWVEAGSVEGLDGPVAIRIWNYDPATGELESITNTNVTSHVVTNGEALEFNGAVAAYIEENGYDMQFLENYLTEYLLEQYGFDSVEEARAAGNVFGVDDDENQYGSGSGYTFDEWLSGIMQSSEDIFLYGLNAAPGLNESDLEGNDSIVMNARNAWQQHQRDLEAQLLNWSLQNGGYEGWQEMEMAGDMQGNLPEWFVNTIEHFGGPEAYFSRGTQEKGDVIFNITTETTRFDDEGRTTGIYRDDDGDGIEEQVGGFDYSSGNMTSWYIDPEGMRTDSTYDSMGRIQRAVTQGDVTSEVDLGADVESRYQYMTIHIHSVTTFVYNDTAESVTLTYSDEPEYDVSLSGDFDLSGGFSVSGGESGGMPSVDTSGMDVDADLEVELTPNDDREVFTVTVPPGGLMTSRTVSTTTGSETFDIGTSGIIPIDGEATVYVDNITETTMLYENGMGIYSISEETHNGSYVDIDIDERSAWTVAIMLLIICVLLAWCTNGLSLYAWASAAIGAYQTYNDIMDMEGTNPVPNLPTNIYDPNNAYDEVSIKPPIEPPTESEFGTNDAYIR